jgi:hypothetical protein
MSFSSWRRFWNTTPGPVSGRARAGERPPSYRPRLDPLEDRVLPAPLTGAAPNPAPGGPTPGAGATPPLRQTGGGTPVAPGAPQSSDGKPLQGTGPVDVAVDQNTPRIFLDLGPLFGKSPDLHPEDGLRFSVLGNTNPGLVKTSLSEAEITLTFAPGKYGTATLTVGATDADGACAQATISVKVRPCLFTLPPMKPPAGAGTAPAPTSGPTTFPGGFAGTTAPGRMSP